jgi:hypothetical protein
VGPQVESRFIAEELLTAHLGRSQRPRLHVHVSVKLLELPLDLQIASSHEFLVMAKGSQRLLQCEHVLGPVVSGERLNDHFLRRLHSPVPQSR